MPSYGIAPVAVDDVNGNTYEMDPSTFAQIAQAEGRLVLTPSVSFSLAYNGAILQFMQGEPFVADAGLQAALAAISAPVQ